MSKRAGVNRNLKRGAPNALAATLHRAAFIAETERLRGPERFGRTAVHPNYALAKACRNNSRTHDAALRYLHDALGAPRHLFAIPKRAAPLLFELGALVAETQSTNVRRSTP